QEGLIRTKLYFKDTYHIQEVKQLFFLKSYGYKNEKVKKEDKEEEQEEYKLQRGSIPVNLENAINIYKENKQSYNFLITVLKNMIKDYNDYVIRKERPIETDVNKNIKKKTLEEILELLTPKDRLNLQFQKLILMKNN
ncbi:hypothetical protein D7X33_36660, partial [Butyricicoccus sp. 1XD8-22]